MNTDVDPAETDAGASVGDVRLTMNELPEDDVSDSVIVAKLTAAEAYITSIAAPNTPSSQIKQAEIARAAVKVYGSESSVKQKQAADVSKTWDTDGLRNDLLSDWEEWLALIRPGAQFEVY